MKVIRKFGQVKVILKQDELTSEQKHHLEPDKLTPEQKYRLEQVAATMAVENMPLTQSSRQNLEDLASGRKTREQLTKEITEKYKMKMEADIMRESINVAGAPAAVGPYVHAVKAGELLFLSGQLGLNPEDGILREGIEAQTKQSLENLKTVLEGCGSDLDHVVKTSIFIADMGDFGKVNEVYAQYFTKELPARSCVAVKELPKSALVEIEVIAVVK